MNKKKVVYALVLRSILAGLGAILGGLITLLLLFLLPSTWRIAPSLFVLNAGFFTAYCATMRMEGKLLAACYIYAFVVISVLVCLAFFGPTSLCVLNILGYQITIAGCAIIVLRVIPAMRAALGGKKEGEGRGEE